MDWRALLSQPAAASVVVKKSPFDFKKRDAGIGAGQGGTTPASSTAADAQADSTKPTESVVPIVLLKAAMPQHPVERYVCISQTMYQSSARAHAEVKDSCAIAAVLVLVSVEAPSYVCLVPCTLCNASMDVVRCLRAGNEASGRSCYYLPACLPAQLLCRLLLHCSAGGASPSQRKAHVPEAVAAVVVAAASQV